MQKREREWMSANYKSGYTISPTISMTVSIANDCDKTKIRTHKIFTQSTGNLSERKKIVRGKRFIIFLFEQFHSISWCFQSLFRLCWPCSNRLYEPCSTCFYATIKRHYFAMAIFASSRSLFHFASLLFLLIALSLVLSSSCYLCISVFEF